MKVGMYLATILNLSFNHDMHILEAMKVILVHFSYIVFHMHVHAYGQGHHI